MGGMRTFMGTVQNHVDPGSLRNTILEPLKWENEVLNRLLFQARYAHRRKRYWVQTKYASSLVDDLIERLNDWDRAPETMEAARAAVSMILHHLEEAATCWRESLIVFGFFGNVAETAFAALAREVKLLVQFQRQYLGLRPEEKELTIKENESKLAKGTCKRKLRSPPEGAKGTVKRRKGDALSLFLERVDNINR